MSVKIIYIDVRASPLQQQDGRVTDIVSLVLLNPILLVKYIVYNETNQNSPLPFTRILNVQCKYVLDILFSIMQILASQISRNLPQTRRLSSRQIK